MIDIKLDQNGDLELNHSGDLVLTTNNLDYYAQKIKITLKTIYGEWFLDPSLGLTWFNMLANKDFDEERLAIYIKDQIMQIKGIKSVTCETKKLDRKNRIAEFKIHAVTKFGEIKLDNTRLGEIL